jgi:hypothetical protein
MIHETFPFKELDDYWSTRPRYEAEIDQSKAPSGSGGESYQDWLAAQKEDKEGPPPPPYSLEADETGASVSLPPVQALVASSSAATPGSPQLPSPSTRPVPSSATPGPPPIDPSSRPRPQPHNSPTSVSVPAHPFPAGDPGMGSIDNSVHSLTDDFNRQRISTPGSTLSVSTSAPPQSLSPPIPLNTRPNNALPAGVSHGQGSWAQSPWPPPEWKVKPKPPQHPQHRRNDHHSYLGHEPPRPASSQPTSYATSHHSSTPPLRPHTSVGTTYPPNSPQHSPPNPFGTYPYTQAAEMSYPYPGAPGPMYPPEPSSMPPFPSYSPPLPASYAHASYGRPHSPGFEAHYGPPEIGGPQFPQVRPSRGEYFDVGNGPPHHQYTSQYPYPEQSGPSFNAPYFPHADSSPGPAFPIAPGFPSPPMPAR